MLILNIAGNWKNKAQLIKGILSNSDDYLMMGYVLHNIKKDMTFQVEIEGSDPYLREILEQGSEVAFDEAILQEIDEHTCIVKIMSNRTDFRHIKEMIDIAGVLLKAGGLAVEIEASGIAYIKEEWNEIAENKDETSIHGYFVSLVEDDETEIYYSRGMQFFGLPDTSIPCTCDADEANKIITEINLCQLIKKQKIKNGHTFNIDGISTTYKIHKTTDFRYDKKTIYFNPHGVIKLTPIKEVEEIDKEKN